MYKILYIHDREGWALYNVGRYWASLIEDYASLTFIKFGDHESYDPRDFDFIFWGCSYMAERHLKRLFHLIVPRRSPLWNPVRNHHFITVVHDPCEIFPQRKDWQTCKPRRLSKVNSFNKIAVISNEMKILLNRIGLNCSVINTNSTLPLRPQDEICHEPLKIFSRARNSPRKNIRLFKQLQYDLNSIVRDFNGYFDDDNAPVSKYIKMIDKHNCYICTSWQEGGPLPLMDAMRRGCMVLTTPVGQTDELIIDGVTGFICNSYEDFKKRIMLLIDQPEMLLQMRRQAQKAVDSRSDQKVRKQLIHFLEQ